MCILRTIICLGSWCRVWFVVYLILVLWCPVRSLAWLLWNLRDVHSPDVFENLVPQVICSSSCYPILTFTVILFGIIFTLLSSRLFCYDLMLKPLATSRVKASLQWHTISMLLQINWTHLITYLSRWFTQNSWLNTLLSI